MLQFKKKFTLNYIIENFIQLVLINSVRYIIAKDVGLRVRA